MAASRAGVCPHCATQFSRLDKHTGRCPGRPAPTLAAAVDRVRDAIKDLSAANGDIHDVMDGFGSRAEGYLMALGWQQDVRMVDGLTNFAWPVGVKSLMYQATHAQFASQEHIARRMGVDVSVVQDAVGSARPNVGLHRLPRPSKVARTADDCADAARRLFPSSSAAVGKQRLDRDGHPVHYVSTALDAATAIRADLRAAGKAAPALNTLRRHLPKFCRLERNRSGFCQRCSLYYDAVTQLRTVFAFLNQSKPCTCRCHVPGIAWVENKACLNGTHKDCEGCPHFVSARQVQWCEHYFTKAKWSVKQYHTRKTTANVFFKWFDKQRELFLTHIGQKEWMSQFRKNLYANRKAGEHFIFVDPIMNMTLGRGDTAQVENFGQKGAGWVCCAVVADTVGKSASYFDYLTDDPYDSTDVAGCVEDCASRIGVNRGDTVWVMSDGDPTLFKTARWITLMWNMGQKLGVDIRIHFMCPGHGKSLCDEHAGRVKKRLPIMKKMRLSSRRAKYSFVKAADVLAAAPDIGIDQAVWAPLAVGPAPALDPLPLVGVGRCHLCVFSGNHVLMKVDPCLCPDCVTVMDTGVTSGPACRVRGPPYVFRSAVSSQFLGVWVQRPLGWKAPDSDTDSDGSD